MCVCVEINQSIAKDVLKMIPPYNSGSNLLFDHVKILEYWFSCGHTNEAAAAAQSSGNSEEEKEVVAAVIWHNV